MTNFTGKQKTLLRTLGFVAALSVAAGCTPVNRFHGFTPSQDELAAVQVGVTTRDAVRASFGPPTAGGLVDGDPFYYVSSQVRHFGALPPREVNREVLAISFLPNGTVRNIERFGLEDGRVVILDRRVTDDGIRDVSALAQLIGSIGRIDAGSFLN